MRSSELSVVVGNASEQDLERASEEVVVELAQSEPDMPHEWIETLTEDN